MSKSRRHNLSAYKTNNACAHHSTWHRLVCGRLKPIWSLEMFSHPAPHWLLPHDASLTHCGLCHHHFLPAVYSHNFLQHPITWSPYDLRATVSSTTSSDTSYAHMPCAPVTRRSCVERVRTNNCLLFMSALQMARMTSKSVYWGRIFWENVLLLLLTYKQKITGLT